MKSQLKPKLRTLYRKNWDRICAVRNRIPDASGPFLLGFLSLYERQRVKLMVIGQETSGWTSCGDVDGQMAQHDAFHNGREYKGSPFHRLTRMVEDSLGIDEYSCVYGNFNRFDVDCSRPTGTDAEAISELDFLVMEEVRILKPDVCIFFTGPTLDKRLRSLGIEISPLPDKTNGWGDNGFGWGENEISHLKHPRLPLFTFRANHSRYFWQNSNGQALADDFQLWMKQFAKPSLMGDISTSV